MNEIIIPMTFELRALGICYVGFNQNYFKIETPTELIVITSSESYDDIYNGTKYQLLNSGYNITVDDIRSILEFLEENREYIENSIRKLRGGKNGI